MYRLPNAMAFNSSPLQQKQIIKNNGPLSMLGTKEVVGRAITNLAVGTIGAYFILGETTNMGIFGINLPSSIVVGASSACGSLANSLLHDRLYNALPQSDYTNVMKFGTTAALSGGGTIAGLKVFTGLPMSEYPRAGLLGYGTNVLSDYLYNNVVDKSKGGFLI